MGGSLGITAEAGGAASFDFDLSQLASESIESIDSRRTTLMGTQLNRDTTALVKGFVALGLTLAACGGTAPPPAQPNAPPPDRIGGCWRDPAEGTALCLEPGGYTLLLADGKWDRVLVDWAERSPTARSGRTRTPRPLWLSVRFESGTLVMDDGATETRLRRPEGEDAARIERRRAALPSIEAACTRARECEAAAGMPAKELSGPRACIAYLNAVAAVLRKAGTDVPAACVPQ